MKRLVVAVIALFCHCVTWQANVMSFRRLLTVASITAILIFAAVPVCAAPGITVVGHVLSSVNVADGSGNLLYVFFYVATAAGEIQLTCYGDAMATCQALSIPGWCVTLTPRWVPIYPGYYSLGEMHLFNSTDANRTPGIC